MKTFLFALASLVLLSASKCSRTEDASNLVELQSGACFGFCPVFQLTALNNGLVRYEGTRFVEKEGRDSFNLTREELNQLKTKVKEVNLWQYPDDIKTDVVDAPFVTLVTWEGDRSKSVRGSIDRPAPLLELENLMKDLAEAHGIQVKRGVNPNEIPAEFRREVIVKFKPEVDAGNWITQFTDIKLTFVRRMSEENIWIVAYDSRQIEEKTLIPMLQHTNGVVEVQPNKQVEERN